MTSSWTSASREEPLLPQQQLYTTRDLDVEDAEGDVLAQIESQSTASINNNTANDDEQRFYRATESPTPSSLKSVAQRVQKNTVRDGLMRKAPSLLSAHHEKHRSLDFLDHRALYVNSTFDPRTGKQESIRNLGLLGGKQESIRNLGRLGGKQESLRNLGHRAIHENDLFHDDPYPFPGVVSDDCDDTTSNNTARKKKRWNAMKECCNPLTILRMVFQALRMSAVVWLAIPLAVISYILYYYADDPDLDFLPGEATLSWWFNFAARLCITLGIACFTQYIFIDCILLTTGMADPLVTLTFLQAKGWPFLLAMWSFLNLILLQGDNQFQCHWLFWTGLDLYNTETGNYVLESGIYLRLLLSGLIAGCLTAAKRTFMALVFGSQQLKDYQPRLEKVLAEMVIMSEIGTLATKAGSVDRSSIVLSQAKQGMPGQPRVDFSAASQALWSDDEDCPPLHLVDKTQGSKATGKGSVLGIKELLVRWNEPKDKRDKSNEPTIRDILRFRHALSYLDDAYPFGEDFGPAANRDECIASSHRDFWLLMRLTPQKQSLPFDVLQLLAVDKEGAEDRAKAAAIRKLFRPNSSDNITLLAFVQSCDNIYKHFRFFRASLSNANVINDAIERMMNVAFFFVLTLLLLSMLNLNPWALLFSITSLLVSISFALGSSVSKYVEGMLLIIRRPYDLGDRIFFSSAEAINPEPDVTKASWFVEDISLSTTKLRYARTNEVSTVNNWSIAGSRIVNLNRSPRATINTEMFVHMKIFESDNLKKFRAALDGYVADRPRTWESVSFCRHDGFEADKERVKFSISVRHRNSWQDASRIKINRADLFRFLHELAVELSVQHAEPPPQQLLYYGGTIKQNSTKDGYQSSLLDSDNINNPELLGGSHPLISGLRQRERPVPQTHQTASNDNGTV